MVLLKNDNDTLPLEWEGVKAIHMVGEQLAFPVYAGGGSGAVHENHVKSPLESMCDFM
jgi:hypothetical protein